MTAKRARNLAFSAIVLIAAAIWIFPPYWALTTSLRSENRIISDAGVLIDELNFSAYIDVLSTSKLPLWYLNSVGTSVIITVIVLLTGIAMVSKLPYTHVMNRYLRGKANVNTIALYVIVALLLLIYPQWTLAIGFVCYAISAPAWQISKRLKLSQRA